ncbi:MAG: hypothetical protein JXJ04_12645, partial [Spirochaetales bacterium]|nr:hypothetical protein [Spirochaetales bacterium]
KCYDIELPIRSLFEEPTIEGLGKIIEEHLTDKKPVLYKPEQGEIQGEIPLIPIQKWFFNYIDTDHHHWNQSILLELLQEIDESVLKETIALLLKQHDALRINFNKKGEIWNQKNNAATNELPYSFHDLSPCKIEEIDTRFRKTANQIQAGFNLSGGLLCHFALFHFKEGQKKKLLIVIHHLIVDDISWRILLEDLETTYLKLAEKQEIFAVKTTSFKRWAEEMVIYSNNVEVKKEADFWMNRFNVTPRPLPTDYPDGENIVKSESVVTLLLDETSTKCMLTEVPKTYRTTVIDILLTALYKIITEWSESPYLLIDMERHGREHIADYINVTKTIGWFTSIHPVLLMHENPDDYKSLIKAIKEQIREIPVNGFHFGMLKYLTEDKDMRVGFCDLPKAEILFHYLGRFDQSMVHSTLFTQSDMDPGQMRSPACKRTHILEINVIILNKQLRVNFTYSKNRHKDTTIQDIADRYMKELHKLIDHCVSIEDGGFTPSDFPGLKLDQIELDKLINKLK